MSAPRLNFPYSSGGGGGITGSGTSGYVAKFTSGTAVGNSVMVELGSAIGIGATPDYINAALDVNGNIIGRYNLTIGGTSLLTASNITSAASRDLVLQRDTVEAARIIAGGKVGFGNTDPATLIETYGTTGIRASSDTVANIGVFQYSTDTSPATLTLRKARGTRAAQTTVATGDAMGSVNFTAYGGTSGSVLSSISGNVVTYTSNANISSNLTFGTSASGAATPTTRLTIDEAGVSTFTGPVRATGTAASAPAFTGSDTDTGMYFPAVNQVRLSTNATPALSIDASQNVGIGNTTGTILGKLHVGSGTTAPVVTTPGLIVTGTTSEARLVVKESTVGAEWFVLPSTTQVSMGTVNAYNLEIKTTNATRITVSAAGDTSIANMLSFNSGFGSAAVAYGTRAWVNFNGSGVVAIRGSGNVSTITDLGVGSYQVNFTTSMPDVNYSAHATVGYDGTVGSGIVASVDRNSAAAAVGSVRVYLFSTTFAVADSTMVFVSVTR